MAMEATPPLEQLHSNRSSASSSAGAPSTPPPLPSYLPVAFPQNDDQPHSINSIDKPAKSRRLRLSRSFGGLMHSYSGKDKGKTAGAPEAPPAAPPATAPSPSNPAQGLSGAPDIALVPPAAYENESRHSRSFWNLPSRPSLHMPQRLRTTSSIKKANEGVGRKRALSDAGLAARTKSSSSSSVDVVEETANEAKPAMEARARVKDSSKTKKKTVLRSLGLGILDASVSTDEEARANSPIPSNMLVEPPKHLVQPTSPPQGRSISTGMQARSPLSGSFTLPAGSLPISGRATWSGHYRAGSPALAVVADDERSPLPATSAPAPSTSTDPSTSSATTARSSYRPKPLLLPAFTASKRHSSSATMTHRRNPSSTMTGSRNTRYSSDFHRVQGHGSGVHSLHTSPSKPRKAWLLRQDGSRADDVQRLRESKRERKRRKEVELAALSLTGRRSGIGGGTADDSDAWTWVETSSASSSSRASSRRNSVFGEDDEELAPVWRASLDVGRRVGRGKIARGKPNPGIAPRAYSHQLRHSPSSRALIVKYMAGEERERGLMARASVTWHVLLNRLWGTCAGWSPNQKAKALFGLGLMGGWVGSLLLAFAQTQMGLPSGLSPVTIALFPTLASGGITGVGTGVARNPGFFLGVGIFFRGL